MANKRHFTGTVTKVHENFGFIDEDVFFQAACCDGRIPVVGDSVVVDAQFNLNMPFKWNATRVKVLPKPAFQVGHQQHAAVAQLQALNAIQSAQQNRPQFPPQGLKFVHGGAGLLGAAPSTVMGQRINQPRHQQMHGPKGNRSQPGGRQSSPQKRNRDNRDQKKRSTTTPSQTKGSPPREQRSISKDKRDKNQRHPAPRYMVQCTKRPLTLKSSDMLGLKGMHVKMYIPSDFYAVNFNWQDTFGLKQSHTPRKCHFHILQKDVETLVKLEGGSLNPPDSDHSWVAKVMLLQTPPKDEIYKQCCRLAEESSEHFLHQSRIFKFLVGNKGKKELMALGGSWSPSLDGPDPAKNPHTLVNTAIRTCRALTGIDLSKCTNWRRMIEIHYHRDAEVRKGRNMPDRVETTVIFLPDIHSCMPTSSEYSSLCDSYINKCEAVIQAEQEELAHGPSASQQSTMEEEFQPTAHITENVDDHTDQKDQEVEKECTTIDEPKVQGEMTTPVKEECSADDNVASKGTPTNHAKVDIKTMKVQLLRKELESRGLSPRGLKAALITRLSEALQVEAQKELDDSLLMDDDDVEMKVLDEAGEKDESKAKDPDTESAAKDGDDNLKDEESKKQEQDDGKIKEVKAKSEEKTEEKKEKDGSVKEELEEKPKKEIDVVKLKQHYTLPESHPVIPVHPNSEFKKGSFECSVTPLSNLLSYRHEDNKESIFEVSLFAEAFSEMLQRSHAFNIYKALSNPLPQLNIGEEEEDKKVINEQEDRKGDDDEEPNAKKRRTEEEGDGSSDDDKKSDKDMEMTEKTQLHLKDAEVGKKDVKSLKDQDSKSKEQSSKMVTLRKELLLSFVYFDQTQCGYIKSTDMATIIHSTGLGLSRSQITKLLSNYVEHGNLNYRKLTDVPATQLQAYQELLDNSPKADLGLLASGNKPLMMTITDDITTNGGDFHTDSVESDGIVNFNGAVVDIKALQDKLSNGEEDQANMETMIKKLTTELDSTSKELSKTQDEKEKLQSDYDVTKKKLSQTQDDLGSANDTKTKFEKTLKSIAKSIETAIPKEEK